MPFSVEMLNDDTLYATLQGNLTVDDVIGMFQKSAELMGDAQKTFYRITDVTDVDTDFAQMLQILGQSSRKDMPGGTSDERLVVVFYGTNHWTRMVRDYLMRQRGAEIAAFDSLDEVNIHIQNLRDKAGKE